MCGIIGYLGHRTAGSVIYAGLKALEYRGYDSAGVAVVDGGAHSIKILKDTGKVDELNSQVCFSNLTGSVAIGHVRWATHGGVTQVNAHPHVSCGGRVALVHNGIIENYRQLREQLRAKGHSFSSQTDSEVIPHLIEDGLNSGMSFEKSVLAACALLKGSFAFLAVCKDAPLEMAAVRNESPLIIGVGEGEFFAASDCIPFLDFTKKAVFLNDGEAAFLKAGGSFEMRFFDFKSGRQLVKEISEINWSASQAQKGEFEHFMLKEIMEEPYVFKQSAFQDERVLKEFAGEVLGAKEVFVVASGTSYHAALVGRHWFKQMCGKDLKVVLASEFSLEAKHLSKDSLVVAVSQSGETMDVMDCVRAAKEKGARVFSIVNVVGSTVDRMSERCLYLNCGPEVGVAATKSFLNQLGVFLLLAFAAKGEKVDFAGLGVLLEQSIEWNKDKVRELAKEFKFREHAYFLGRACNYAIALEGALKLKEISYIHAEGMASGELKHGTLALIEKGTPVILLNPQDESFTDSLHNGIEAKARGAKLIALANDGNENYDLLLKIPTCDNPAFYPVVEAIPLQLLAYYAAVERGRNPDKPRNLAKSVTVR
ncbi:MAG: glutamine--fructose-6-phosphate transaminase (isomerizing) [Candidatus Norongarragalinales archaeon]